MNHAIKSLNTFLDHLYREKIISYTQRCESFGEHLLNTRTIDDVVSTDEMERVHQALIDLKYRTEALLFRFFYFSGMRFNEALAISVTNFYEGEIESDFLRKKLKAYEIKYHGYVVSHGQRGSVLDDGQVIRAPFKGRKKIEERYNRAFPIADAALWNSIADLVNQAVEDRRLDADNLIFPRVNETTATNRLIEAFQQAKLRYRPWHCLRHSRATYLIGETSDAMLARVWLGQSSPKTIERYNHLYQAITRAAKTKATATGRSAFRKV